MGRSVKDLRRSLAPVVGLPATDDQSLLRTAVPPDAPQPLTERIQERRQELRAGYPKTRRPA